MWHIVLAAIVTMWASAALAHEEITLHPRLATPGLRLELRELPSTDPFGPPRYALKAFGLPPGVVFDLWSKDFGHAFHNMASAFHVGESGHVVSSQRNDTGEAQRLEDIPFSPGRYPRGAVWEVAIVSGDRKFAAFAKVIPYPIATRHGPCTLSLELTSLHGQRFMASGVGFAPGEEVVTEVSYAGRVLQRRRLITSEGILPRDVIFHDSAGADRNARYAVKGRSCEMVLDYEWGEPALSRR